MRFSFEGREYRVRYLWEKRPVAYVRVLDKEGYYSHWRKLNERLPKYAKVVAQARAIKEEEVSSPA